MKLQSGLENVPAICGLHYKAGVVETPKTSLASLVR